MRTLCGEQASISAVCRELGINRQQFARYLAGRSLPSQANLAKICKYFGVTEGELFAFSTDGQNNGVKPRGNGLGARMIEILEEQSPARMAEGAYWVDFASPAFPTSIVRAVMLVRHEKDCTSFRRLTGRAERKGSWWGKFQGDHEGIVIERRGMYFFTAMNAMGLQEPSMLVMRAAPGYAFNLIGTATIMGTSGAMVMAAAISETPKSMRLSAILRKARSFEIDAPDIPIDIIDLLNQENERLFAPPRASLGGTQIN
ncbi:MAG: helix-turn-helix domain-containing protein [Devosiaceae bacterium]